MSDHVPPRLRFGRHRPLMLVLPLLPRQLSLAKKAVGGGVDVLQLRDRSATPEALALAASKLAPATPALLLINSDLTLAREHDGVHLPEGCASREARLALGEELLVGCSVHSVAAAVAAVAGGADYLVAGTIFASPSHPDREPAGVALLKAITGQVKVPVLAIGGITPERVADCLRAGARGVAVMSSILEAEDPRATAAAYRTALEEYGR